MALSVDVDPRWCAAPYQGSGGAGGCIKGGSFEFDVAAEFANDNEDDVPNDNEEDVPDDNEDDVPKDGRAERGGKLDGHVGLSNHIYSSFNRWWRVRVGNGNDDDDNEEDDDEWSADDDDGWSEFFGSDDEDASRICRLIKCWIHSSR